MGLEFKPEIVELTDDELLREIRAFERTYGMSSEQFLERFNRGQLGPARTLSIGQACWTWHTWWVLALRCTPSRGA
jgi:hypothetical protein